MSSAAAPRLSVCDIAVVAGVEGTCCVCSCTAVKCGCCQLLPLQRSWVRRSLPCWTWDSARSHVLSIIAQDLCYLSSVRAGRKAKACGSGHLPMLLVAEDSSLPGLLTVGHLAASGDMAPRTLPPHRSAVPLLCIMLVLCGKEEEDVESSEPLTCRKDRLFTASSPGLGDAPCYPESTDDPGGCSLTQRQSLTQGLTVSLLSAALPHLLGVSRRDSGDLGVILLMLVPSRSGSHSEGL